jgi:AraC-like DNA-binding protein
MLTTIDAVRLLAASQVVLLGFALALSDNPRSVRALAGAWAVGVLAYFLTPVLENRLWPPLATALILASELVPAVLVALIWRVFEDRSLPRALVAVVLAGVAVIVGLRVFEGYPDVLSLATWSVQCVKVAFALLALWLLWAGREDDLGALRPRLRLFAAALLALLMTAVVLTELVTAFRVPRWLELGGMSLMALALLAANLFLLRWNPRVVLVTPGDAPSAPADARAAEDPLVAALLRAMEEERLYADHDLRVGSLAAHLGVPEYRLRRLINGELGHRNFNRFVNGWRIDEASRRLRAQPDLPVLSIALDVGFRSLSSFNAAFRDRHGCTPTVWRGRGPTDSRDP